LLQEILSEEKVKAAETIEEIKKEHETNISEVTARHESELQVNYCSS
jgi:hypothetical protein